MSGSLCFRLVVTSFWLRCLYFISLLLEERCCWEGRQQMWGQMNGRGWVIICGGNTKTLLISSLHRVCYQQPAPGRNCFFSPLNSPEELSSSTVEYTKESFLSGVTQDMLSCWTKTEHDDYLKHFRSTSFLSHSDLWNPGIENEAISLNKIQERRQSGYKNGIRRRFFQGRTQLQ